MILLCDWIAGGGRWLDGVWSHRSDQIRSGSWRPLIFEIWLDWVMEMKMEMEMEEKERGGQGKVESFGGVDGMIG